MDTAAFIGTYNGQSIVIPGYSTAECVAVFWRYNQDVGVSEAYSAPGACNLWTTVDGQPYLWDTYDRIPAGEGRPGDFAIWSGSSGPYHNGGWGHVALLVQDRGNGWADFFSQNPGACSIRPLRTDGILGYLRYKGPAKPSAPADPGFALRTVTNDVAFVRTGPGRGFPEAAGYEGGIANGETLAVRGYVAGEDPYETGDNAWYMTKSGFYVWANAAGNDLSGLALLS